MGRRRRRAAEGAAVTDLHFCLCIAILLLALLATIRALDTKRPEDLGWAIQRRYVSNEYRAPRGNRKVRQ